VASRHDDDDAWRKSSASGQGNDCLEVCFGEGAVRVRHSKDPGGQIVHVSGPEWRAFLTAVRRREFS
jgi:Domain of unknown function (DUF397)